jgi:hypothetical protein
MEMDSMIAAYLNMRAIRLVLDKDIKGRGGEILLSA